MHPPWNYGRAIYLSRSKTSLGLMISVPPGSFTYPLDTELGFPTVNSWVDYVYHTWNSSY